MKEESENKKEWVTPEIIDLDVDKTSKDISFGETGSTFARS